MIYETNRSAIKLSPTEEFVDWLNEADAKAMGDRHVPLTLEDAESQSSVYLIPWVDNREDAIEYVKSSFHALFELELAAWMPERTLWPKELSWELFDEFFFIVSSEMVFDALDTDIDFQRDDSSPYGKPGSVGS